MRGPMVGVAIATVLLACAPLERGAHAPTRAGAVLPELWAPPADPSAPELLRLEPTHALVAPATSASFRLEGELSGEARCDGAGVELRGKRIRIEAPPSGRRVEITCSARDEIARAELVSFSGGRDTPLALDPYAGGVVLIKTRRRPPQPPSAVGARSTGLFALDELLDHLGAYVFSAFPFDRTGTRDRVGLGQWLVVDLPAGVHALQASALLRECPDVHRESWLPLDADFLRVQARPSWPAAFRPSAGRVRFADEEPTSFRTSEAAHVSQARTRHWELRAIGAPEVWDEVSGAGVGIAVVDSGVDRNHAALEANLRFKNGEGGSGDGDGNGVPGDRTGVNLAHLAIAYGDGPPWLALGLVDDVSDWANGSGHGTQVAALAAGAAAGGRPGAAPGAWLLPVDVQENRRATESRLLDPDPRMRAGGAPALREDVWSRAAGVVYAVAEGARVVTCAWSPDPGHWILHDALQFAEENCALPVCAADPYAAAHASDRGQPAGWRKSWLAPRGAGTGAVLDAWTGARHEDFFQRPLLGLLLVDAAGGAPGADLYAPTRSPDGRGIVSARSTPANDAQPISDRKTATFEGPGAAVGLVAGVAALVAEARPDLPAREARDALVQGARDGDDVPLVWAPGALREAHTRPQGHCGRRAERLEREREATRPWYQRIQIRGGYNNPATPDESPRRQD